MLSADNFDSVWAACDELHFGVALVLKNFGRDSILRRDRFSITVLDCLHLHEIPCIVKSTEAVANEATHEDGPVVAFRLGEPLRLDAVLEALHRIVQRSPPRAEPGKSKG